MSDETKTLSQAAADAPPASADSPAQRRPAWLTWCLVSGLLLAAVNLRPAIPSLGALLEEVRDGLHMSGSVAGVLTSVPPFCFALFGFAAPRLARRFGPGAIICAGMVAITAGLLIRPFASGTTGFLAASVLALAGIAVGNVLMPVIVKRYFPDRIGTMTGLYSLALSLGTALAAAATVPITEALGGSWREGLGIWAVLGAVAIFPWLALVRDRSGAEAQAAGAGAQEKAPTAPGRGLIRNGTAWALACFFGLQATGAYIIMGWMPQRFRDAGLSADTAGLLLAVTMVMGVPLAFVIPRMATRMKNQGPIVLGLGACGLIAFGGLYVAPAGGAWVWAVLLGISNCSFPLALTMIGMRAGTGAGVARLSAFAQSTGYLISIPGPLLVGVLYQHSGGWGLPLALMAGLLIPQMVMGVIAGRDRTIED
ncbi:transporter [Streptomyces sp. 150FB]|uniref:CynX/NimT family MFS transporter n=1 Tax=Streptomyces sp. 150FB TaxID=1576605 RepID=UPI000588F4AE|nr:MFS transporter [Streptomyces sp. 150FB]KIF73856.1 transporter [Streptomyces sp. 150FB]